MSLTPGIREKHAEFLRILSSRKRRQPIPSGNDNGLTFADTSHYQQESDFSAYGERVEEDDSSSGLDGAPFSGPLLEELPLPSSGKRVSSSQFALNTPSPIMQPPRTTNSGPLHSTRSGGTSVSAASTSGSASSVAQAPPPATQPPASTYLFPIDGSGISKALADCSTNNLCSLVELLGFPSFDQTRKKPSKFRLQHFFSRLYGGPSVIFFDEAKGWLPCPGADVSPPSSANAALFEEAFPILATLSASISPPPAPLAAPPPEEEPLEPPLAQGSAEPLAGPLAQ